MYGYRSRVWKVEKFQDTFLQHNLQKVNGEVYVETREDVRIDGTLPLDIPGVLIQRLEKLKIN